MAARPRKEYVSWVRPEGQAWIGFWYVYEEGRRLQKRRKVCDRKEKTLTQAREMHEEWLRCNVETVIVPKEPDPSLRELWERHISKFSTRVEKGKRSKAWRSTLHSLWKLIEPMDAIASEITGDEVEEHFHRMEEADYSASTRRKVRALLAQLLRGHSTAVQDADLRITSDQKLSPLAIEQVRALRLQLRGIDLLIFDVYVGLGLSAHEGFRLRVRDPQADRIWIPGSKTVYRPAELPLPADLGRRLTELADSHRAAGRSEDHRLLFGQSVASWRPWLENVLQPAAARSGIPAIDMLILRRTAGTLAAKHRRGNRTDRRPIKSATQAVEKNGSNSMRYIKVISEAGKPRQGISPVSSTTWTRRSGRAWQLCPRRCRMSELTTSQVVELVERIVADDFCEDLGMMISFGHKRPVKRTRQLLAEAQRKLEAIYRITHSHQAAHSCHHIHGNWRKEAVEMFAVGPDGNGGAK